MSCGGGHLGFPNACFLVHLDPGSMWTIVITWRPSSVNFSHFKLLHRNHWANWNQTYQECSLDGSLHSMELLALKFRCQCTQQKFQSICAIVTFDPQLKKTLTFSVKDRYRQNFKLEVTCWDLNTVVSNHVNSDHVLSFSCLDVWTNRQATSGVSNTSIYSVVFLASPYYNYL
jgi:hypothetical protein